MDFWWPIWLPGGFSRDPERNFASGDSQKTPKIIITDPFYEEKGGMTTTTTTTVKHLNPVSPPPLRTQG